MLVPWSKVEVHYYYYYYLQLAHKRKTSLMQIHA